jgi:hypothetical protein
MAALRTPSRADLELAKWVTDQGWPTTPRQIRSWRAEGWVAQTEIKSLGRGKGKAAVNTKESFDQALAVAEIRGGKRKSPYRVVLSMFARGMTVPEDQLRAAYATYFAKIWAEMEKATADEESDLGAAEKLAGEFAQIAHRRRFGRYLLGRAGQTGESPTSVVQSASTVAASALLGGELELFDLRDALGGMPDAIDELLDVTGMAGLATSVGSAGPIVPTRAELREDLLSWSKASSIEALAHASQELSLTDLAAGRDNFKLVLRLARDANAITKAAQSPDEAFGTRLASKLPIDDEAIAGIAVMVALVLTRQRQVIEEGLPIIEASARRTAAVREALNYFPRKLHRFLGPEGSDRLARASKAVREEFEEAVQAFANQRPDLAEIIAKPVGGET